MTIKEIEIKKLKLLDKNPRTITKQALEKLVDSIKNDPDFLKQRPVLVNLKEGTHYIYAGNQRVKAAKKLKWLKIPCAVSENLSEERMKERIIKDNQTYGEFDYGILNNDWSIDLLIAAGVDETKLSILPIDSTHSEEEDNFLEPKKDEDANTKIGDLYQLNDHRLFCGDSTNPDCVSKLLEDKQSILPHEPILMVTDPPYGVNYDARWRVGQLKGKRAVGKVQNDDKVNWALSWSLFPGSVCYVWHASLHSVEVAKSLEEAEYEIINQIIWNKQHFAMSRGDYHWKHEPCFYAVKKGHKHNWQGSRKECTVWEVSSLNPLGKQSDDERTAHSTQKPIECMLRPIKNNTSKGEGVYDPFIGSGTTLIAAEKLDRICYGMELSPAYCDVVVERWVKYMKSNSKSFKIKKNEETINV